MRFSCQPYSRNSGHCARSKDSRRGLAPIAYLSVAGLLFRGMGGRNRPGIAQSDERDPEQTPQDGRCTLYRSVSVGTNVEPNVLTVDTWRVRKMTREIMLESQIAECSPLITSELLEDGKEPNKILLITSEEESSQPLHTIADATRSVCNAAFSKPNYLEIVPLGVHKAEALRHLASILGLELSQIAAIGDGLNDIEMLSEAGLGIAMGNAPQAVKSVADWVTGTNNEAGVAQAVERLFKDGLI